MPICRYTLHLELNMTSDNYRGRLVKTKGVDPDKKVRGTDWWVTQPFPAGGLAGRCKPPSGVRGKAPEANAFWNKCFEN